MPHQNIFRCHIKRPGPRAGTKTAVPVGRARTPASPPFATNRTVTIPAILSSRTRAKAPCVHLRSITPCQASRIATAELRRQASLTLAFRPAVGGLEPRPPYSVSSARLGRRGGPHGICPRNNPSPEDGLPARRAGKAEAKVAPAAPRPDPVTHGRTAIRRGDPPAPAGAKPRHAICDTIRITLAFLPPVVLSISV